MKWNGYAVYIIIYVLWMSRRRGRRRTGTWFINLDLDLDLHLNPNLYSTSFSSPPILSTFLPLVFRFSFSLILDGIINSY